ncbi:MAG TPA: DUF2993 domain-containing protein [Micromonosporaceae bacterium]|nr:DUF2993 domain-containing protein [Micromonosporaceae bacterium]
MSRVDRPRRGGRGLRITLFVVLGLLVVLVAADRIGLLIAEHTVAGQVRTHLASEGVTFDGDPHVTIHGFPFLTQVLAGHYDRVDISVANPSTLGVRLDSLTISARDVSAPTGALIAGNGHIEAATVAGTGSLDWTAFTQLVDLSGVKQYGIDPKAIRIGSADAGHVSIQAPASLDGQTFTVNATGTISVKQNILHVGVSNVTASDTALPPQFSPTLNAIAKQFTFDVRIPQLPYRLSLDSVRATAQGIAITASARDIVLGG